MKRILITAGSLTVAAIVSIAALSRVHAQAQKPAQVEYREKHGHDFIVVREQSMEPFRLKVSEKLKEGYTLRGDMIVRDDKSGNEQFYQALIW